MSTWRIKLLYDGLCPVCASQVRLIRRLDRHNHVAFEDVTAAGFDPGAYGLTSEQALAAMHGVRPDGSIVAGMEAVRAAYDALGLGWLAGPTGWPVLRPIFDACYRVFASLRPRSNTARRCTADRCAIHRPQTQGK